MLFLLPLTKQIFLFKLEINLLSPLNYTLEITAFLYAGQDLPEKLVIYTKPLFNTWVNPELSTV